MNIYGKFGWNLFNGFREEELNQMWKANGRTDAYPWQKLTWPMARWAKKNNKRRITNRSLPQFLKITIFFSLAIKIKFSWFTDPVGLWFEKLFVKTDVQHGQCHKTVDIDPYTVNREIWCRLILAFFLQKRVCFILVCEILAIFVSSVFNFGHFWFPCA